MDWFSDWFSDWWGRWFGNDEGLPPEPPPDGDGGVTVTTDGPIPDVLPPEVVEAVARCACCREGSGSGSDGSGGTGYCCKCTRFACANVDNFPASLSMTLVVPCLGTKTFTVSKVTNYLGVDLVSGCRPQRTGQRSDGPGGRWADANVIYSYSENTFEVVEQFTSNFTDCNNGLPVSLETINAGELFTAEIMCMKCAQSMCDIPGLNPEEDGAGWVLFFQWWVIDNVTMQERLVHGHMPLTVVSCEPLSLTGTAEIECRPYLTDPETPSCLNYLLAQVHTYMQECEGGTVQADADE